MFCRKGTEQVEFRRIEVEGMPDSKVGSAKPEAKEANESFDLYLPEHRIESRRIMGT
jgi:hypothetical protein